MSKKAHGTCEAAVQENLRWSVDREVSPSDILAVDRQRRVFLVEIRLLKRWDHTPMLTLLRGCRSLTRYAASIGDCRCTPHALFPTPPPALMSTVALYVGTLNS